MSDPLSIFVRSPISVVLHLGERERTVTIKRVPARHAAAWDEFWTSLTPDFLELSHQQSLDQQLRFVKAGIPEPRADCPPYCACAGNDGLHADIDALGREELDQLYYAVRQVNSPKDAPDALMVPVVVASGAMRLSLEQSPRAWTRLAHSIFRSKSSAT